jgi:uncharacterized cupredoxin-like copper-binding protein
LRAVLAALSTEHQIGMLVAAGLFIGFALLSSFVFPRYWPEFPGSRGLTAFIVASLALTVAMLLAVEFFAVEEEEAEAGTEAAEVREGPETTTTAPAPQTTTTQTTTEAEAEADAEAQAIDVAATEFAYRLSTDGARPGVIVFRLKNDGQLGHDLAIDGEEEKTPVIDAGATAELEVELPAGTYELYCSVPGHRDAGMEAGFEVA